MHRSFIIGGIVLGLATFTFPTVFAASPSTPAATATPSPAPTPPAITDPAALQLQQALAQQAQIQATKTSLAGEISAAQGQKASLLSTIAASHTSIALAEQAITQAEAKYELANKNVAIEKSRAAAAQTRESKDKQLLAQYLTLNYQSDDSFANYLLSSSSFSDLVDRSASLSRVIQSGNQLLIQVKADELAATQAETNAENDAASAQSYAAMLVAQNANLQTQIATESLLAGQLDNQSTAAAKEISSADSQSAALAQQIAALRITAINNLINEAEQSDWAAAEYYLAHNLGNLPTGAPFNPGVPATVRFIWPVPGSSIAQGFGPSPYPFEPAFAGYPHFHTGIDLAAPEGTPVYAAADGVVAEAISSTIGYGNHIMIAHDAYTLTLYGHLETMLVNAGDVVKKGQLIGLVGSTGNSTGPHTHFEVRISGNPVDPTPYLPPLAPGSNGPRTMSG